MVVQAEDPVLSILFRTFAGQVEKLYEEAESTIRYAVLDDLIAALGIGGRRARPAQMVLGFALDKGSQVLNEGTAVTVETKSRDKLTFATDSTIMVSAARIALAATYQDGKVQLVQGVDMPHRIADARPATAPEPADLGKSPAILVAVENLPPTHLSQHAFFFEFSFDAQALKAALLTETWCLAGPAGDFGARGILRPFGVNGGVRALNWLLTESVAGEEPLKKGQDLPTLPEGFYAGRIFVFPMVEGSRRFLCRRPKGLERALDRIFGPVAAQIFQEERAWLRISLPNEIRNLSTGLVRIALHATSASNVECLNETVRFGKHGTAIPGETRTDFGGASFSLVSEKGPARYLVAPLSVFGETGSVYLSELQPSEDPGVGRYRIRNGQIQVKPAQRAGHVADQSAILRLWVTRGKAGNQVEPGKLQATLSRSGLPTLKVGNLTGAEGGTDGEGLQEARMRFAEALLSRDRIVTRADLLVAARAFDRRIIDATVSSKLKRTLRGLQRVHLISIMLDRGSFLDLEEEVRVLKEELTSHLLERFVYDTELEVEVRMK